MPEPYDVAILGATPAGYAAAYYLARHRRRVVLIEAPHPANECPLADWVPRGFFQLAGLPKSLAGQCGAEGFQNVSYHNAKMDRRVEYRSRKTVGLFVQQADLAKAQRAAAVKAGVKVRSTRTPPTIHLQEDQVRLVGTVQVTARILLIAHSRPSEVLRELALPLRTVPDSQLVVAALDVPAGGKDDAPIKKALHVVELPERSELGIFFPLAGVIHIRVISNSPAAGNRAEELSRMVTDLQAAGILPADLQLGRARGAVWNPPAGVALDLETHVAKRCILAGTAGGFAESITGQTVRPSVASALLAAKTALAALKSAHTQDTLMQFKTAWRDELADGIRPPNTSLQLLLPLLFVNQNIVNRFTRALLYGDNI